MICQQNLFLNLKEVKLRQKYTNAFDFNCLEPNKFIRLILHKKNSLNIYINNKTYI